MNVNDNIPYEIALKLKAIGFNLPCTSYYTKEDAPDNQVRLTTGELEDYNDLNDENPFVSPVCSAPTYHAALEWLREKHRIHCFAVVDYYVEENQTEIWKSVVQWVDCGYTLTTGGLAKSWTDAIKASINHAIIRVS